MLEDIVFTLSMIPQNAASLVVQLIVTSSSFKVQNAAQQQLSEGDVASMSAETWNPECCRAKFSVLSTDKSTGTANLPPTLLDGGR